MSLDVHRLNVVIRHTLIHPEQQTETDATPGFSIIRTIICTIPAFKTPKKQTPVSLMFSQLLLVAFYRLFHDLAVTRSRAPAQVSSYAFHSHISAILLHISKLNRTV